MNWKKNKYRNKKKIDEAYVKAESKKVSDKDIDETLSRQQQLLNKLKHKKWDHIKTEVYQLIEMLKAFRDKTYTKTPWKSISAITFTLLYIINPLDLAPDFIPFIGYLDDISVLTFCLKLVKSDINDFKNWKEHQEVIN